MESSKFNTFHTKDEFFQTHSRTIIMSFLSAIVLAIFLKYKLDLDDMIALIIMVSGFILSFISWRYNYSKYSIQSYIEITNDKIVRNENGKVEVFQFSTLRDVEIFDGDKEKYNVDYINLFFGDGRSLEIDMLTPNFIRIKIALLNIIAIHPDLDFLRKRLSKLSAG